MAYRSQPPPVPVGVNSGPVMYQPSPYHYPDHYREISLRIQWKFCALLDFISTASSQQKRDYFRGTGPYELDPLQCFWWQKHNLLHEAARMVIDLAEAIRTCRSVGFDVRCLVQQQRNLHCMMRKLTSMAPNATPPLY